MIKLVLGTILAVCIGITLGLIGGGGSILALPILKYIMGIETKSAVAMTLVIVGAVSLIGVIPHWLKGNVNFKTALLFSPAAMLGAYLGARIASLPIINPTIQLICFAVMMLVAAFFMIRKSSRISEVKQQHKLDEKHHDKYRFFLIPAEGLVVGIVTGFVGVGGGFMIIPALVLLGKTPMKEAVGTSLLIITFKSLAGFAGYFGQVPLDINIMIIFTIAASLGTIFGAYLTEFIKPKLLEKSFGYFVIAVAVYILIQR
ncbi:MAG: sulfite exporter TauE/SafE family protein [Richelia sp. RM2_1_2]|nr:sulfite exporter TauE/SafE family protein [Richelia sp. SM2_1_7]NJM19418.1 sulfite exporter TauE/SafE family protein [Richelia sp. SM1_7_0]NJN08647.1 sulfite exporter TauE/SafE family protein [Richelia sp. RM1_1_1]NJO59965.1 sulfite exporter TauE/SafE family protein [Richelia sp. RM2_1_2]